MFLRLYEDIKKFGAGEFDKKARMEKIMASVINKQDEEEEGKQKTLPWHLMNPNSHFKQCWNIILIVLLTYTATFMPYQISFLETEGVF